MASENTKEARKKTNLKLYGAENAFASEEIKERIKDFWKRNYGAINPSQVKHIRDKIVENSLEKYGTTHHMKTKKFRKLCKTQYFNKPGTKEKQAKLYFEKTGYLNPFSNPEVQEKVRKTTLLKYGVVNIFKDNDYIQRKFKEKYGVLSPMQVPEIFKKQQENMLRKKECLFKGEKIYLQGYEPFVLEEIEHFITKFYIPKPIKYIRESGKDAYYYPDLLVKTIDKDKRLIEVKSIFTLMEENNELKWKAARKFCKKKGYTFWIAVYFPRQKETLWFEKESFRKIKRASLKYAIDNYILEEDALDSYSFYV